MIRLAALLLAIAGPAAAQAPAPAPSADQASAPEAKAKPRPPLNLKLDETDQHRPRVTFDPRDSGKKQDAASELPGLGGRPANTWERPSSATYPPDTNPGH